MKSRYKNKLIIQVKINAKKLTLNKTEYRRPYLLSYKLLQKREYFEVKCATSSFCCMIKQFKGDAVQRCPIQMNLSYKLR